MKEYLAPDFEKTEYIVEDCLTISPLGKESDNIDNILGDLDP